MASKSGVMGPLLVAGFWAHFVWKLLQCLQRKWHVEVSWSLTDTCTSNQVLDEDSLILSLSKWPKLELGQLVFDWTELSLNMSKCHMQFWIPYIYIYNCIYIHIFCLYDQLMQPFSWVCITYHLSMKFSTHAALGLSAYNKLTAIN